MNIIAPLNVTEKEIKEDKVKKNITFENLPNIVLCAVLGNK